MEKDHLLKTLILNSTHPSEELFIDLLSQVKGIENKKVLVVSYFGENINYQKLEDLWAKQHNSINFLLPNTKRLDILISQLKCLTEEDIVYFLGIEKILTEFKQNSIKINFSDKQFNFKSSQNIDTIHLINFIETIWGSIETNLLFILNTEMDISEKVISDFSDIEIDIFVLKYQEESNLPKVEQEIFDAIQSIMA